MVLLINCRTIAVLEMEIYSANVMPVYICRGQDLRRKKYGPRMNMALVHPHSPAPASVDTENARPEWMRFGSVA